MENRGVLIVFVIIVLAIFVSSVNQDLAGLAVSKGPFVPKQEQSFSWQDIAGSSSPAGGSGGGSSGGGSSAGGTCPKGSSSDFKCFGAGSDKDLTAADEKARQKCAENCANLRASMKEKQDEEQKVCLEDETECLFKAIGVSEPCVRVFCVHYAGGNTCEYTKFYETLKGELRVSPSSSGKCSRGGYLPEFDNMWDCVHVGHETLKTDCVPWIEPNGF